MYMSGLRTPIVIPEGKLNYRRSIAMNHSFRKFFDTTCTNAGMNPIYIEWCMGHSLMGVKDSYFLPQPDSNGVYMDILEGHDKSLGYIDAIPYLTIDNSQRLKRENEILKIRKDEIQQLRDDLEQFKQITRKHINAQVKESTTLGGIKLSDEMVEWLYKEDKERLVNAISKYKKEHDIID